MNDAVRKPQTMFPAPPKEQKGIGRFRRIVTQYSTAPMELACGGGAMARGIWVLVPYIYKYIDAILDFLGINTLHLSKWYPHPLNLPGPYPIWAWGVFLFALGYLQVKACLAPVRDIRWQRIRTLVALLIFSTLCFILTLYFLKAFDSIAVPLYALVFVMELWIMLRGFPIFGSASRNGHPNDP